MSQAMYMHYAESLPELIAGLSFTLMTRAANALFFLYQLVLGIRNDGHQLLVKYTL